MFYSCWFGLICWLCAVLCVIASIRGMPWSTTQAVPPTVWSKPTSGRAECRARVAAWAKGHDGSNWPREGHWTEHFYVLFFVCLFFFVLTNLLSSSNFPFSNPALLLPLFAVCYVVSFLPPGFVFFNCLFFHHNQCLKSFMYLYVTANPKWPDQNLNYYSWD